jgi:hypothetical protein
VPAKSSALTSRRRTGDGRSTGGIFDFRFSIYAPGQLNSRLRAQAMLSFGVAACGLRNAAHAGAWAFLISAFRFPHPANSLGGPEKQGKPRRSGVLLGRRSERRTKSVNPKSKIPELTEGAPVCET